MELWMACVLLLIGIGAIAAAAHGLRQHKALRAICIVLCALAAFACAVYIGLTFIFVEAVRNSPPAP